jgi:hypothetical protein
MDLIPSLITASATLIVGAAGILLAKNISGERKLKLVERRMNAYEQLWELLRVSSPTAAPMSEGARWRLHASMTDWYYTNGNGLHLSKDGQQLYLKAKTNLICSVDDIKPSSAAERIKMIPIGRLEEERGKLASVQLSLLRTQLKKDITVHGRPYGDTPDEEGFEFLKDCNINVNALPWSQRGWPWPRPPWWPQPVLKRTGRWRP